MNLGRTIGAAVALAALGIAHGAETTTYTYDPLGRVTEASVSGGVAGGVKQVFGYDSAGNMLSQQTFGPLVPRPVAVAPVSSTISTMGGSAVTLTVGVSGTSPGGTVTFRVDGLYVGSSVISNGRASLRFDGFPPGTYSVTVSYGGDASNDPSTSTFNVKVQDLSWLPAVLDLLLSD